MIWFILLVVFLAGAAGGVVNALLTDNGFILPKKETSDGREIVRPGVIGNVVIGAFAAVISWGLYGPFSDYALLSETPQAAASAASGVATGAAKPALELTLAALVGGILVGVGGARWLTSEVDKRLLKASAAAAAASPQATASAAVIARQIDTATPTETLHMMHGLPR